MKIAIDVTPLETGHAGRGVGVYTKLLIEALQKYETKHTYHFFTRRQNIPKNADIVHYPYFDPFFLTLPLYKPKPTIVTVHDLIPLVFPDKFPAGLRGNVKWQIQKMSLRGAARIIADSQNSKRDVASIVGIDTQKIDVVYLAPSEVFKPIVDKTQLETIRKKYRLPKHFILYVGDVNWNKNIMGLLKAFQNIKYQGLAPRAHNELDSRFRGNDMRRTMFKLVIVGKAFFDSSLKEVQEINFFIDTAKLNEEVMGLGGVSLEDLVAIYNLAHCLVQPSFYEGFGLPVLEAMACGCPVVTSHAASLSEIAGPAIMIDPNNPGNIAVRLLEALNMSAEKRQTLLRKGKLWAERFSWEAVVHQTVRSYGKAIA